MNDVTVYGREVVVRSRRWFGPFNCVMYEVSACEPDGSRTLIAVFNTSDEAWKYIANAGHRVRNGTGLLLAAIDENKLRREMDELRKQFEKSLWNGGAHNA